MVWILMVSVALNAGLLGFIYGVAKAGSVEAEGGAFEVVSGGGWGQDDTEDGDFDRIVGFKKRTMN